MKKNQRMVTATRKVFKDFSIHNSMIKKGEEYYVGICSFSNFTTHSYNNMRENFKRASYGSLI